MANVLDYINWRGDLGFDERPFNEVDSLILCQISYIDMRPVLPGGGIMTVHDMVGALLAIGRIDTLTLNGEDARNEYTAFAEAAAASRRFGPLLMEHYVDIRDRQLQTQFSAVTFRLDAHTNYVAYRGTDDSIVGWKEDFMISFERIPAQSAALNYLTERMEDAPHKRFHVGGHSKGANLALYSAVLLPDGLLPRLEHVHLYDGPGLCGDVPLSAAGDDAAPEERAAAVPGEEAPPSGEKADGNGPAPEQVEQAGGNGPAPGQVEKAEGKGPAPGQVEKAEGKDPAPGQVEKAPPQEGGRDDESAPSQDGTGTDSPDRSGAASVQALIAAIDPIATKIVPEYDVVGKIFEMPITDNRIVKSDAEGVMQHGILTWQLTSGGDFDLAAANTPGSIWIGKAMDAWIGGIDNSSRKVFVDELFAALSAGGDNLSDLSDLTAEKFEKILAQAAGMSPTSVDVAISLPIAAATGIGRRDRSAVTEYLRGLFRHNTYSRAFVLLGIGICCLLLPGRLLPLTLLVGLTGILAYIIFYYIKRLWQLKGDFRANQTQGYVCLAALMIYVIVMVKQDMLMMISNMVYGGVFLFLSYHIFQRLNEPREHDTLPRAWSIAEGTALVILAILVLTVPTDAIPSFTLALGSVLTLDGIAQLIHVRHLRRKKKKAQKEHSQGTAEQS